MKTFEISSRKGKNGRRKFKTILHKIYQDSCVDAENQLGTEYNRNGITWLREYCENALGSINGMSLRCEFLDEERTELCGHGETGEEDGLPIFEDAVQIGTFTKGYIDEVENDDGEKEIVCIGEGYIDELCYHNFVTKLDEDIANDIYPNGSVEIMRKDENDAIIYKYGYKPKGRIPMEFIYSGYALLGVPAADSSAKLIELNNNKEEVEPMGEKEMKALIEQVVSEMTSHNSEINQIKTECEAKIAEVNEKLEAAVSEKNEVVASSEELQKALDALREEVDDLHKQLDAAWEERKALEDALGEAKARERLAELNSMLSNYSEEEVDYAKEEIEAFKAEPMTSEINSIEDKILREIGKNAKEEAKKVSEQNAEETQIEDIFSGVELASEANEDINIF